MLEETAFNSTRAKGTPEAYHEFARQFPDGVYAARAAGNAAYLEGNGFSGRPEALDAFATEHPESDFAAEARRSVDTLGLRQRSAFQRVGLRVEVSPATPEASRLIEVFTDRATEHYRAAGIELVPISDLHSQATSDDLPEARLTIQHGESLVQTVVSEGDLSRPGVMARTVMSLRIGADGAPIWEREFDLRVDTSERAMGSSILFGPTGRRYWDGFFVPVAAWQSNAAIRSRLELAKQVTAVDAAGDRAVVVFEDGGFQIVELADPEQPVVLAEHRRPEDFKQWDGVRLLGDRIAVFGVDGLEIVGFGPQGTQVLAAFDRDAIGSLVSVTTVGDTLLLGGNRGLLVLPPGATDPARALNRKVRGLASVGEAILITDGESLLITTLSLLRENRLLSQLRLGKGFGPGRIRVFGSTAIVIGDAGVLVVDMRNPRAPRLSSQLYARNIGSVVDASLVANRVFLLGERGVQVLDAAGQQVIDSIDVSSRERIETMGRHVIVAGGEELQVLDATPFTARVMPASGEASKAASPAETVSGP